MKSLLVSTLGATVILLAHASDASSAQAPLPVSAQARTRADVVDEISAKDTLSPMVQPGEVAIPNPDYRPAPPTDPPKAAVRDFTAKDTLSPMIQPGEVAIPNPDYRPAPPSDPPKAAMRDPRWVPGVAPWNTIN